MTAPPSRLELVEGPDPATLMASGVIDSHTADELLDRLTAMGAARDGDVVVDLAGVEFIDSSGLRSIILAHQRLADAGAALRITNPSAAVARLLEITGLDRHLNLG